MSEVNADSVIKAYVKTRDTIDAIKKQHTEALRPYYEKLEKLEGWLQKTMNAMNVTALKGESGTAFTKTEVSAKVDEWEATLAYILANNRYELLEKRVSKSVVMEHIETFGTDVPGVSVKRETVVQVRRS